MKKIILLVATAVVFAACGGGSGSSSSSYGPVFPSDLEGVIAEISDFNQKFGWIEEDGYVYLEGDENTKYSIQYAGDLPKTVEESEINFESEDSDIARSLGEFAIAFRKNLGDIVEQGGLIEVLPGEYKGLTGYKSLLFSLIDTYDSTDEAPQYTFHISEDEFLMISNTYESEDAGNNELEAGKILNLIAEDGFGLKYVASKGNVAGGGVLVLLDFPTALISSDGSYESSIFQEISGDDLEKNISTLRTEYLGKFIFYEAGAVKAIYLLNGEIESNNDYADFSIITMKTY